MLRYVIFSLRIRRVEYRIAEVPIFLIPILLTIRDASALLSAPFWEGLLAFFFLFAFGDLLNCLADRELDAISKPYLPEAVYGIGVRGVILQAVLSAVAAVALTAHLAWMLRRWQLLAAVGVALFVAYAYSVPPIRLKGRGLWQLAFYWLGLFTGSMIFSAMLFSPRPPWSVIAVAVFYGMMQTGVILVNTAEDYPEDRQMGVKTVIVAVGLRRGIALAVMFAVLGSLGLLGTFAAQFWARATPLWAASAMLPIAAACALVTLGMGRLKRRIRDMTEVDAISAVKRSARWVPVWITSGALASLLAATALHF